MNKIFKNFFAISFVVYLLMKTIVYIDLHKFHYTGVLDEIIFFTLINIVVLVAIVMLDLTIKTYKDFRKSDLRGKVILIIIILSVLLLKIPQCMKDLKNNPDNNISSEQSDE